MSFIDNPLYIRETHKAKNCEAKCCLWESLPFDSFLAFHKWYHEIIHFFWWIFHEINHPFGDTSIYIIYDHLWKPPVDTHEKMLPQTILQLLDLPYVCWECILTLCCLSKNMLLGFVSYVFTCCIDKYQNKLLGNLIIDYLACSVGAPYVFLMLQYQ